MSHDDFNARVNERHQVQVAEGKHDDECEFRADGFFICNCSPRRRVASGYTDPPGELIHQYPLCPRCQEEVAHDGDCFYCPRCAALWPDATGPARFNDDHGDLTESLARHEAARAAREPS